MSGHEYRVSRLTDGNYTETTVSGAARVKSYGPALELESADGDTVALYRDWVAVERVPASTPDPVLSRREAVEMTPGLTGLDIFLPIADDIIANVDIETARRSLADVTRCQRELRDLGVQLPDEVSLRQIVMGAVLDAIEQRRRTT